MTGPASDILWPAQQQTAAAYRRLADAALAAAEEHAAGECGTRAEGDRYGVVLDRMASVKHARIVLDACRVGVARGVHRCAS